MNQLQQTALHWLDQGVATIPIGYRSKRPDIRHLPNGWHEFQKRLPTIDELRRWFSSPLQNMAVVMRHNNLVCCDFDNEDAHALWLTWASGRIQQTYKVKTRRGFHYYYNVEDLPDFTMKWVAGVDVKCSGYCLAPPSIHPSGTPYKVVDDSLVCGVQSINDLFPDAIVNAMRSNDLQICNPPHVSTFDPWQPAHHIQGYDLDHIKTAVSLLDFFPQARRTSNGWYQVHCPLHDDRHESAWVDTRRNRFGCHVCVNGSMSNIDFYMALYGCDMRTAVMELSK